MALCLKYAYEHYGEDGLREYLERFALIFHKPLIEKVKEQGIAVIADYLKWLYTEEEALDALELKMCEKALDVTVRYCPGVKHLKLREFVPHESYERGTSVVYGAIAKECGLEFEMISYDHDTGAAHFRFRK